MRGGGNLIDQMDRMMEEEMMRARGLSEPTNFQQSSFSSSFGNSSRMDEDPFF